MFVQKRRGNVRIQQSGIVCLEHLKSMRKEHLMLSVYRTVGKYLYRTARKCIDIEQLGIVCIDIEQLGSVYRTVRNCLSLYI